MPDDTIVGIIDCYAKLYSSATDEITKSRVVTEMKALADRKDIDPETRQYCINRCYQLKYSSNLCSSRIE